MPLSLVGLGGLSKLNEIRLPVTRSSRGRGLLAIVGYHLLPPAGTHKKSFCLRVGTSLRASATTGEYRVLPALFRLHVRLQRIAEFAKTAARCHRIDPVATPGQFLGDPPRGLARPPQEAHRVTGRGLLHDPDGPLLDLGVGLPRPPRVIARRSSPHK